MGQSRAAIDGQRRVPRGLRQRVAVGLASLVLMAGAGMATAPAWAQKAVTFDVRTVLGSGTIPVHAWPSAAGDTLNHVGLPQPFKRVVIVVHDVRRTAADHLANLRAAWKGAGDDVLLIAPQFSRPGSGVRGASLTWAGETWVDGGAASGSASLSSFDVLDTLLLALADTTQFPALQDIVIAGFSAGGEMVQRYAVVGAVFDAIERQGIRLRWVVGNPGSLLYLDDRRPGKGGYAPARAAACPDANRWKYGFDKPVPYVAARDALTMRADYTLRDVVFVLGSADTNALHPLLDKSCAAQLQGEHRYDRARQYLGYMKHREPERLAHRWGVAPGAGHHDGQVFGSACGKAALFDTPGCSLTMARDSLPPVVR